MKKSVLLFLFASACASPSRKVVDQDHMAKPEWVQSPKVSWVEGDQVMFRSQYTIRGDERLNGCYQLVKLDSKETLLREISEDIRGQIDNAQQGISENTELVLSQVRTAEFSGKVTGMKFVEQFDERYVTNGVERIDCFVLSGISKLDYDKVKRRILYKIADTDPDVKKAISKRAVKFFSDESKTPAEAGSDVSPQTSRKVEKRDLAVALPSKADGQGAGTTPAKTHEESAQ